MKFYSKIIGSTLLIFSIFLIILTEKAPYQGMKKIGKNRKNLLIFLKKNDKNSIKKIQKFSIFLNFESKFCNFCYNFLYKFGQIPWKTKGGYFFSKILPKKAAKCF